MGCGKSTIGRQLARKLGYKFIDVDTYIEQSQQMTIPQIFESKGEEYFRTLERNSLHEIAASDNIVVATGGGLATKFDNMEYMNRSGITIYLKMDSSTLINRVQNSHTPRPLLDGKNYEEMKEIVDKMLIDRAPFYEMASIIIEGKNIKIDDVLKELQKW